MRTPLVTEFDRRTAASRYAYPACARSRSKICPSKATSTPDVRCCPTSTSFVGSIGSVVLMLVRSSWNTDSVADAWPSNSSAFAPPSMFSDDSGFNSAAFAASDKPLAGRLKRSTHGGVQRTAPASAGTRRPREGSSSRRFATGRRFPRDGRRVPAHSDRRAPPRALSSGSRTRVDPAHRRRPSFP